MIPFAPVQPVPRTLCLTLSDDRSLPLQCHFKRDHSGGHDWEMEKGVLTDFRAKQLREEQGTPSGVLPVRVPGAALGDAEGSSGVGVPDWAAEGSEAEFQRVVRETWTA